MLLTKLHTPVLGNHIVQRSELHNLLDKGLNRKLILISASAGFGKTTLLSNWIQHNKIATAWYSIDPSDNDPVAFLNYMIAGIDKIICGFGKNVLPLINSTNKPSNESISNLLLNEISQIEKHFVLALDDFHLINNMEVLEIVGYLLDHTPQNMHFAILTRADPSLPVARLRSQGQLVEIRSTDLAFSTNDIHSLFSKKLKIKLSEDDIQLLQSKTEGWIAGLQLLSLSIESQPDVRQSIKNFKGDNRYIMDYLIEEVLKIQPENIREFLLTTSILDQMSASLCNALLTRHDSQVVLEMLERNNMFIIPLDNERKWYRYHHLFSDLLNQRLQLRPEAEISDLNKTAAKWFAENAMPIEAFKHYNKAKDFESAILILNDRIEDMWKNGQHTSLIKYCQALPAELIKQYPKVCLYYSWILILSGQDIKALPFLLAAETNAKKAIGHSNTDERIREDNKNLLGKIAVALAYQHSFSGSADTITNYCDLAMKYLKQDDPLWIGWAWYAVGIAKMTAQKTHEAIDALTKALEFGKKSENVYQLSTTAIRLFYNLTRIGKVTASFKLCKDLLNWMAEKEYLDLAANDCTYSVLYANMASIQYLWADVDSAHENIKIAYKLSANEASATNKAVVLIIYAAVSLNKGDLPGVSSKFKELEEIIKIGSIAPSVKYLYVALKGIFLMSQNQTENAKILLEGHGVTADTEITYANENGFIPYVLLLLSEFRIEEANAVLSKLHQLAEEQQRMERIIEIKIVYSIKDKFSGNKEAAMAHLVEAMQYAQQENILMYFVNYSFLIGDLLEEVFKLQAMSKLAVSKKYTDQLKLALEKTQRQLRTTGANLSHRELDTLIWISQDLSNQEIAEKMFVSLNTVKTHLKNIYEKLEVNNRKKAIEKAKHLNMI